MITSYVIDNIEKLPRSFLLSLRNLLENDSKFHLLEEQLKKSALVLEKDGFQIPFNCPEDLYAAKDLLCIKFKET